MKKIYLLGFIMFSLGFASINVKGEVKEPRTTWDCIWFGTYPQTEYSDVTNLTNKEYIKNPYGENAGYIAKDKNGESITIGWAYDTDVKQLLQNYFFMPGDKLTFRYFKYEPIKWRMLKIDGDKALLLSDKIIDQYYAYTPTFVDGGLYYRGDQMDFIWRNTEIRQYMNNFMYELAFSESEQAAILDSNVTSNFTYKDEKDTTIDKLFILSHNELVNDYGFDTSESLLCKISDFGRGSGTVRYDSYGEYGTFYTLTEGYKSYNIYVDYEDYIIAEDAFCRATINAIDDTGTVTKVNALNYNGIRVAMWVDLTKCNYQYAGTVSSNGDINEVAFQSPSKIKLAKVKIKSFKNVKKKTILLKFRKVNNAKKYQVQYATNKKFKKAKIKTTQKTTVRLKKLKIGKKYYIRVRAINGKKQGKWSKVKKVKIKY